MEVKVLGTWPSPFAMRPRIALHLKSVEYGYIEETMFPKSDLLHKSNPVHKKVPVLFHHDKPICESLVIVQYIDEVFTSGQSILPSDPLDRAVHCFWAAYVDDKLFPNISALSSPLSEEAKVAPLKQMKEGILLLEDAFKKMSQEKPFFGGDKIGYLDIALGSSLAWLRVGERMNNVKLLDEDETPLLVRWADEFCGHDAVKGLMSDVDKFIEYAKSIPDRLKASRITRIMFGDTRKQ